MTKEMRQLKVAIYWAMHQDNLSRSHQFKFQSTMTVLSSASNDYTGDSSIPSPPNTAKLADTASRNRSLPNTEQETLPNGSILAKAASSSVDTSNPMSVLRIVREIQSLVSKFTSDERDEQGDLIMSKAESLINGMLQQNQEKSVESLQVKLASGNQQSRVQSIVLTDLREVRESIAEAQSKRNRAPHSSDKGREMDLESMVSGVALIMHDNEAQDY